MRQTRVLSLNRKRWQDRTMSTDYATTRATAVWSLKWPPIIVSFGPTSLWLRNTDKTHCCSLIDELPARHSCPCVFLIEPVCVVGPKYSPPAMLPCWNLSSGPHTHTICEKAEMAEREGMGTLCNQKSCRQSFHALSPCPSVLTQPSLFPVLFCFFSLDWIKYAGHDLIWSISVSVVYAVG